uniref:Uncharacterized protein n=1 Tax=Panagrolaimus davidi TaxID=227884 RepID=A0A914P858_9BILA
MSGCAGADGTMCNGPSPSKSPINSPAFDCDTAKCPKGYKCAFGMMVECCEEKEYDAFQAAFGEKCPDGSNSAGSKDKGYFEAVFGETCADLVCKKGQKCVQVNKHFAKCCGGKQ